MRNIFYLFFIFAFLNAEQSKYSTWRHFNSNPTKEIPKTQEQEFDFKKSLNDIIANTFENNNGIDQSDSNVDLANENIQLKNLKSLYEGENNSLLFQRELFLTQNSYNYSAALVHRYEKDNILFGVNSFFDKQSEQKDDKSFGAEFAYTHFMKAYSNYYMPNLAKNNLHFGVSFVIPAYNAFTFDVSKDSDKVSYKSSYSPYSVLSFDVMHRDYTTNETLNDTLVQIGFSFNFNESFFKQLKKKENALEEVNRYDFLQRVR